MADPTPRTWVDGELVTPQMMNTEIRDAHNYIFGQLAQQTIAAGNYTGDGSATRVIDLGFAPKFVLLVPKTAAKSLIWMSAPVGQTPGNFPLVVDATVQAPQFSLIYGVNDVFVYGLTSNGFQVESSDTNINGVAYHYFAIA